MKGHSVIKCTAAVTVSLRMVAVTEVLLYVVGNVMQSGGLTMMEEFMEVLTSQFTSNKNKTYFL